MAIAAPKFTVGSLVTVRDREWVVLPTEYPDIINLRPLSGSEGESCGIHLDLEGGDLQPAAFPVPRPELAGDFIAGKLLRNAARLTLRSGAGPFRSFGRLSVRPRPYQFVPLIMALRLEPVRLLIADDVGVGKTIEAGLIAREFLDRGDVQRTCVLCPPHLCDQWQAELERKFHIPAVILRTSTVARLERDLPRRDLSVYEYYPHLVVSIDFAKTDRRREAFLAHCPDLVIVDEAHTATEPGGLASREQQLRHELVHGVARNPDRNLILLTATPHSGIEHSFRSLLGLLSPAFEKLDMQELTEKQREVLAKHFIQRRRADVAHYCSAVYYRPRFLGLSEFGPRNVIYHEGRKYRMAKCVLPSGGIETRLTSAKCCNVCGYFHDSASLAADHCQHCDNQLDGANSQYVQSLFEMGTTRAYRADRITCDEEERAREGFEIETHYRFTTGPDGLPLQQKAPAQEESGFKLMHLRYAPQADLWRVNQRWRRSQLNGFTLDAKTGVWVKHPGDYECLLSYSNQFDHPVIDRHQVRDYLLALTRAKVKRVKRGRGRPEQYEWLEARLDQKSSLEGDFLKRLFESSRLLPDRAQYRPVDGIFAEADFYYDRDNRPGACIFCDGPDHDIPERKEKDTRERAKLEDAGYRVVVIRYDRDIEEQIATNADLFGAGANGVKTGH
jgi:hypothetical protein